LCPGDEVLADQDELEQCLVGGEVAEGEVSQAAVLGRSDAVSTRRAGGGAARAGRCRRRSGW
jgi:hypothetical protein